MPQRLSELTEQQKRCLRFVHQGLTSKEIALQLATTSGVIDNYIQAAVQKLGALNRREAARLLAAKEETMVQQLHLQPEPLADPPKSATLDLSPPEPELVAVPDPHRNNTGKLTGLWSKVWSWLLHHIGGPPHDLSKAETFRSILWTALATTGVLACIITVSAWLNYRAS
ncbi:helix-turn-helix transcriptional regulator (plasmid) [Sphingobium sp. V4]|uniref:helix-turn-helix domain-containing protein n=1 Tax=Sphingobium sp. V4 TaxID=3038927 RepID=UPI0025583998|nr:helix-turn-helix transcriptional regulator [Sphingobium sp. V4]WIW90462.1 helix-turn-helix transcriptional regulator [Sphingobium sp. V4]